MTIKRFAVLGLMVLLGGCYQQASDSFEAVNSDSGAQSLSASPTPQVLNPNADASPVVIVPNDGVTPTDSVVILQPNDTTPVTSDTTPTVVVIMPSVPTNTPLALQPSQLLPTATPPTLITPQSPSQLVVASATSVSATSVTGAGTNVSTNGIITPTDLPIVNEACIYVVQGGDNLFRIAINNNTTLAELLATNNLSENSVIQPGQELQIPNCDANATATALPTSATQAVTTGNSAPATLQSSGTSGNTGTQTTHTVQTGETLSTIAQRYGVTVNAIVTANNLSNPDRLNVGQQLVIPTP
jgi:LysM repeat protein